MGVTAPPWKPTSELVGLDFNLDPQDTANLFPQYAIGLHAWFLDCVRQTQPDLSAKLHDSPEEKAFTLSPLLGEVPVIGRQLHIQQHQAYHWRLTLFSTPLVTWAQTWLTRLPKTLDLRCLRFNLRSPQLSLAPTTYAQLYQTPPQRRLALSFVSPTSFRHRGHHLPLPNPVNLFHSYLRRWNDFSGIFIEPDPFLDWIDSHVSLSRHDIQSSKIAAGKRGSVTGFTGSIELTLAAAGARQNPDFAQLFTALIHYAPYCGTGHKTTFGLGQTRLGWQQSQSAPPPVQVQLGDRIAEISDQLLSQQKRPEGDRARHVCQTRATILARREFGESLTAIAQDLEMPYETVKTYAKLARRSLNAPSNPEKT
ncbi:MAG: CRISPR-associated endoribonuclease Cas6 [Phormidium sp. BM_Day4_Bin.17]|nr:CRISPR-associated endoribonuclease Cas6 [Phormidium sp. BM_Day4_Bin.17]UCJ11081.1 MAG: CRISPR-associated endoribonuclease Cas6 [Phormidium sp. PBR-2020]